MTKTWVARILVASVVAAAAACGGGQASGGGGQTVFLCPAGSMLDPQKKACVAMEGSHPVEVADADAGTSDTLEMTALGAAHDAGAIATAPVDAGAAVVTSPPPPPPPPGSGFAVDVRCNFPNGWVSLLPASKYPKDDQFLMQSLIGLTNDPGFWSGLAEYRPLHPFAAKTCAASGTTRMMAPTPGDYFLLVGQEGTFSSRGTYSHNGVRRKITIRANQTVTLGPTDLTHTWLCISCPWIAFADGHGGDLEPFVVLANRNARARRGTDVRRVAHVPVSGGEIRLRVIEVEQEITHLDRLVLRAGGQQLVPEARSPLALADEGGEVTLRPHTQVGVAYAVPSQLSAAGGGFVDVEIVATGYYDPL